MGYSAEVRFQPHTRELLVLESEADVAAPMKFFLRLLDSESLQQTARREIPTRPMYAGFPGRSVAGPISPSSRYVYFLRSGPVIQYGDDLAFRLTPARWDRKSDRIETGEFHVDSCHVDYGLTGNNEDDLFLHLSCEYASTVAFGSFLSPDCDFLRLEDLRDVSTVPWRPTDRGSTRLDTIFTALIATETSMRLSSVKELLGFLPICE